MVRVVCEAGHNLTEAYVDPVDFPAGCPLCPTCALCWLVARVKKLEAMLLQETEEGGKA